MSKTAFILTPSVVLVLASLLISPSAHGSRWRICNIPGGKPVCSTACNWIIASFPTYKECAAAKQTMRFPASKTRKAEKPAGASGMAACRQRYGKSVSSATLSSNGKMLNCYSPPSNDPVVMRDTCKKRYGPMSQIRMHKGKWYCTA